MSLNVTNTGSANKLNLSNIIGDAVMASVSANKASAVLTVKNYSIETDAQKNAIASQVEDGYKSQHDNEQQYHKEHRHKILHKIFGAIFHIIRAVVHLVQPRKMIKSVTKMVKKVAHPKVLAKSMSKKMMSTAKSLAQPKLMLKSMFKHNEMNIAKNVAKDVSKTEHQLNKALKFTKRTADLGEAGLKVYDGVANVQIAKIKADIAEIQLAKNVSESMYSSLETEKKQQLETISNRLSDVTSTEKSVNEIINQQNSMQSQLVACI